VQEVVTPQMSTSEEFQLSLTKEKARVHHAKKLPNEKTLKTVKISQN